MSKVQIESEDLFVSIKIKGAELCSIKNREGTEYLWQAEESIWARHAPVLFPFVGKLKNNRFSHHNRAFIMPQHGFARDMNFVLMAQNKTSCTFELQSNAETLALFPFNFCFRISYQLLDNKLNIAYQVINRGSDLLYYSIGGHPGFNCPILKGERFEDYYLEFDTNAYTLRILEEGLRTDKTREIILTDGKLPLSTSLFENDALIFENGQINNLKLASQKSQHSITMYCEGWPFFGVWSKKGCRSFICLEPWDGIADSQSCNGKLTEKEGIISLKPQQDRFHAYSLAFT